MKKRLFSLGILAIALVFGMTAIGCEEEEPPFSYEKTTYSGNGHSYAIFNETITWTEAKKYCEKLDGHLATITSQEEQDFIETLLSNKKNNKNVYWLGGYAADGSWHWVTGESFTSYNNWNHDNWTTLTYSYEDKLQIYRVENPASVALFGEWEDDTNEGQESFYKDTGFICEWE